VVRPQSLGAAAEMCARILYLVRAAMTEGWAVVRHNRNQAQARKVLGFMRVISAAAKLQH